MTRLLATVGTILSMGQAQHAIRVAWARDTLNVTVLECHRQTRRRISCRDTTQAPGVACTSTGVDTVTRIRLTGRVSVRLSHPL